MHPAQIKEQRLQHRDMSIVLDMYELMNAEVGRMVIEGDAKRTKKRNAVRTQNKKEKNQNLHSDTSSEEDDDEDDRGGGGGVDFGW